MAYPLVAVAAIVRVGHASRAGFTRDLAPGLSNAENRHLKTVLRSLPRFRIQTPEAGSFSSSRAFRTGSPIPDHASPLSSLDASEVLVVTIA